MQDRRSWLAEDQSQEQKKAVKQKLYVYYNMVMYMHDWNKDSYYCPENIWIFDHKSQLLLLLDVYIYIYLSLAFLNNNFLFIKVTDVIGNFKGRRFSIRELLCTNIWHLYKFLLSWYISLSKLNKDVSSMHDSIDIYWRIWVR